MKPLLALVLILIMWKVYDAHTLEQENIELNYYNKLIKG